MPGFTYLTNGTNSAYIAMDRLTGRMWQGYGASAIMSGVTLYTSCVSLDPDFVRSYKLTNTNNPNGTYCLARNSLCALSSFRSGPRPVPSIDYFAGSTTCSFGAPTTTCFFAPFLQWNRGVWTFQYGGAGCLTGAAPVNTIGMFSAISTSRCFPITFTNLFTRGGYDTYGNFGFPPAYFNSSDKVVSLGFGGTVTVTLDDCDCP